MIPSAQSAARIAHEGCPGEPSGPDADTSLTAAENHMYWNGCGGARRVGANEGSELLRRYIAPLLRPAVTMAMVGNIGTKDGRDIAEGREEEERYTLTIHLRHGDIQTELFMHEPHITAGKASRTVYPSCPSCPSCPSACVRQTLRMHPMSM